ncbi:hypothetical protein N9023_02630 [Opitutaceae bacterium]|nr:hypothetical protein [Opitutaceae bacterium]
MKKKILISIAVLIVLSAGFLSFLYLEVRQSSTEAAVRGNLAQLAAATDQYFLDHDQEWCAWDDLVGPGKYLQTVGVVRGENYREIFPIQRGFTELSVTTEDGRVITRLHE